VEDDRATPSTSRSLFEDPEFIRMRRRIRFAQEKAVKLLPPLPKKHTPSDVIDRLFLQFRLSDEIMAEELDEGEELETEGSRVKSEQPEETRSRLRLAEEAIRQLQRNANRLSGCVLQLIPNLPLDRDLYEALKDVARESQAALSEYRQARDNENYSP